MRRLSGEDAGFLYMDLPGQPMNSMTLGVLDACDDPLTLDELRAHVTSRLDQLPSWRQRVVRVPLDLHHPVAVDDPDLDVAHHVREVIVRGGEVELEAWFAALAEEHLDPDRPLWQVWLVNGLDDGRQAVAVKYHHALADGVGAVATLSRVYSDAPRPLLAGAEPYAPGRIPGPLRLVLGALWAHLLALFALLGLLGRARRGVAAVREQKERAEVEVPAYSGGAPLTALNAFTPARTYTRAELPMAGIKQIKDAAGVTLNDVVLGVVAGAACRYLGDRGGVPDRPLLTTVPMASEPPGAPERQYGNHFWSYTTSLATDVADPWERLQIISATSREGRAQLEALGTDLVPDWLDVMPPALAKRGIRGVLDRLESATDDVDASILVSNIRGPAEKWSLGGRVFTDLHLDGPPSNGVGINVMVWSYADRMLLGVLGYADALDDPAAFRQAVQESFDELLTASSQAPTNAEPRVPARSPGAHG